MGEGLPTHPLHSLDGESWPVRSFLRYRVNKSGRGKRKGSEIAIGLDCLRRVRTQMIESVGAE